MKVYVYSSNDAFARMLAFESESLGRKYKAFANSSETPEGGSIIVLDLDSGYAKNEFDGSHIIGFSENEGKLDKATVNKCRVILHRPFLIDALLDHIEALAEEHTDRENADKQTVPLCFLKNGLVTIDGRGVKLSANEYAMLKLLFERAGEPVSREELSSVLSSSEGNMCDVYICKLRTKLESVSSRKLIYTVRSRGYTLKI